VEPRRWAHLPIDSSSGGLVWAHTEADIFVDPVLLIEDAELTLDTYALRYIRTFELAGKSARVDVSNGYQQGTWEGLLDGAPARVDRSGWVDPVLRFAVNFIGTPPLAGEPYALYRKSASRETVVGAALVVSLPLGEYFEEKLINLGANRFTIRPQAGAVRTIGRWSLEITGEASFFTDNDEFFNGKELEQKPLYALQSHAVYTFPSRFWVTASGAYGSGARSTVDGIAKSDRREHVLWSISAGYPLTRRLGGKVGYLGQRKRETVGVDADTFSVGFSALW
jgi:hypothetical protein